MDTQSTAHKVDIWVFNWAKRGVTKNADEINGYIKFRFPDLSDEQREQIYQRMER